MTFVSIDIDGHAPDLVDNDFEQLTVSGPGDHFACKHCGETWDEDDTPEDIEAQDCRARAVDEDVRTHEVTPAPLAWLNSAGVSFDEGEDSVTVSISVGDPRGAFVFTVRRVPEDAGTDLSGKLIMHLPHPEDSAPHMPLAALHRGTFIVGH